jgi:dihydroorotate dehydrogenase (NAD+) catalytic subunit
MGVNLTARVGTLSLKNPVMLASGCCGYGLDMEPHLDLNRVGGVCLKGLSMAGSAGNPPPRIWETPAGMLNAIGLQNIGVPRFREEKAPKLKGYDTVWIANFYGHTVEQYVEAAAALEEESALHGLEMNISCPNISEGGIAFGTDPQSVYRVTRAVREVTRKPLWVKLSPNVSDITETARAAVDAGADALSCINTLPAMAIDVESRTFRISNKVGGMSGPALRPVAVRMVFQVCGAVKVPVVGIGGVGSASDALEFILAGACAVQVGTALFLDPEAPLKIVEGLEEYCGRHGITDINELVGAVRDGAPTPSCHE